MKNAWIAKVASVACLLWIALLSGPAYPQAASVGKPQTTFGRAQVTQWLTPSSFAVARWEGTVTVFRPPHADEFGPVLTQALVAPAGKPVEMVGALSEAAFVTSNDASSLTVWIKRKEGYRIRQTVKYAVNAGTANSAAVVKLRDGHRVFISGHENGYVLIWSGDKDRLRLIRSIDVRSLNPIPSEYQLKNVRGLAIWKDDHVVSGSEDGDLTVIRLSDGSIVSRQRYNDQARRGINAISTRGDYLVVANCSVGSEDRNLWLFRIVDAHLEPLDSTNLVAKVGLPQVFDFDVDLFGDPAAPQFLASTEEGLLWSGRIRDGKLEIGDKVSVSCVGGAAIDIEATTGQAAVAAFDVMLFMPPTAVQPKQARQPGAPSTVEPSESQPAFATSPTVEKGVCSLAS